MRVKSSDVHRINSTNIRASIYVTFEDDQGNEISTELIVIDNYRNVFPRKYQQFYGVISSQQRLPLITAGFNL